MKSKKSEGLSINMIVIAAIALGVLVVTFIIFTGQTSSTAKTLQSCELKNGKCAKDVSNDGKGTSCQNNKENSKEYNIPIYINDPACGESKLCCLKIG